MTITAEAVKQLRERTGAGMMECKKALVESGGNLDAAAELMRKQGLAKADKKATRVAAEGTVVIERSADGRAAVIVEVNSETDFVAREQDFRAFAQAAAQLALKSGATTVDTLMSQKTDGGETLDERRRALVSKIGENIAVRRLARIESPGVLGSYVHTNSRVGALVALKGGDEMLAKNLAMHVAATKPAYGTQRDVPADTVAKEREILTERTLAEGKSGDMVPKIVEGKLRKFYAEVTLVGQPFVMDDKVTVEQLLKQGKAELAGFACFEVGQGIEKKQADFAAEVMATVQGSGGVKH
ncbi:MAG TPA: translation elongation factor Ts [Steroidobacteraceae bacterium]|nr:translation elongation factor Ts [Steroidobacteraceae bacterium]